jgi:hypothetical protein
LFLESARTLIVCYGNSHRASYKRLFGDDWTNEDGFLITRAFGARVILTPHFVSPHFAKRRKRFFELCLGA